MTYKEPITVEDVFGLAPIEPAEMDPLRREEILRAVDYEMRRRGFDRLNEQTRLSEILTAEDYNARVTS